MFKSHLHIFDLAKSTKEVAFLSSVKGDYSYRDLDRFTGYFQEILKEHSDSLKWPVAFLSESSDELVLAIAACWRLGVPIIPLNPKSNQKQLEAQITALHPSLIFTDATNKDRFTGDDVILLDKDFLESALAFNYRDLELPDEALDENLIFGYFFTSGTTSSPKIVPLKRRQIISAAESSSLNFQPDPDHYWLLCLPLNHVGGITIILRSLIYGSAIYRMNEFNEQLVRSFLSEDDRFQAASLVPTMLKRLMDESFFKTHKDFKAILLGGGPITESLIRKTAERGIPLVSSYGMTETCAQIAANAMLQPSGIYTPFRSVGRIFSPNEIQIRDENGKVVGRNESGMIWLRGPQVFDGYYEADNTLYFDEDGWFNTRDFGHLNAFNLLFIESRRTDLIITGGENVNPHEVEHAIMELPHIKEAVVLGIPDDEWGQRITAFVTLSNGKKPELNELRDALRDTLIDYKLPRELRIVDHIPKTTTGKVKRKQLYKLAGNF